MVTYEMLKAGSPRGRLRELDVPLSLVNVMDESGNRLGDGGVRGGLRSALASYRCVRRAAEG